jgi:hypothetical protein
LPPPQSQQSQYYLNSEGGSDALHAASIRLALAPAVALIAGTATPALGFARAHRQQGEALREGDAVVLEPFDLPGSALFAHRLSDVEWRERARRQPGEEGCLVQAFNPPQVTRKATPLPGPLSCCSPDTTPV